MDDNDTTFNSLQFQNPNLSLESDQQQQQHDNDNNEQDDDDGDDEYEDEVEAQLLSTSLLPPGADFTAFPSETLDFVPSSSTMLSLTTDQHAELAVSSSQQQQFPIDVREVNSLCSGGIKEQVGVLKSDISAGVTVPYAGPQTENQLACLQCPTSSELSPTSVTQSSSLTIVEERPTQNSTQYEPVPESDLQKSSDLQAVTIVSIMKTPCPDGYNWRKYGQKQVKSTKGSRSYYKCTYSDCFLKKIECSDHSGGVIETIYKGTHNHEPLRKSSITKESRPVGFSGESGLTAHPIKTLNNLPSSIEHMEEKSSHPESKRLKLMDSGGTNELIRDKQVVEPKPKKRLKKSVPACPGTVLKPDKKPELVVHAASDVGISSDSYRWRKYGQKMVKGNPHPRCIRNYYRCTSAGCPARKHMETAIDNTSALIIAYKGVHDHDVPMKRQSPPSADMVAAVAPLSMSTLQIKSCDSKTNQISSTQRLHDIEVELTPETQNIVGMKSMEPARTVLSVGFEIKPC